MGNNIIFISNIVFEPYLHACIAKAFSPSISNIQTLFVPYEELNDNTSVFNDVDIVAVCLNFEALYSDASSSIISGKATIYDIAKDAIKICSKIYNHIKSYTSALIIWFGFDDYSCKNCNVFGAVPIMSGIVDKINQSLLYMLDSDVYIDSKKLIATLGISNTYNNKGKYRWNAPYSKEFVNLIAEELYKQYLIFSGTTKKCLVLDCDNVLWGGILSEDGIDGIHISNIGLGRPFQDFQRFLLNMYYHGVILAICSKNDESDVLKVFQEHTGMVLREENISCFFCNWDNKPDNIKAISECLNIELDSIVFVDDSVFEIESVKSALPDVIAILYQRDSIYQKLSCFNLKKNSNIHSIKERTNTYKTNFHRANLKMNTSSFDEYIAALNMNINIHKTTTQELSRVSELTQRTNKCTNGIRYTLGHLKEKICSNNYELYTVCLADKFSDLGVVGVMGGSGNEVDLFSLSCRALGRNIEDKMISWLLSNRYSYIRYIKTGKNDKLKERFELNGLRIID